MSSSNAFFDIAVLTDGVPVALIEAKAAMSFDLVKGGDFPESAVLKDFDRLKGVDFEGERYALPFVTNPHQIPRPEYDVAMPASYIADMRRHGAIEPATNRRPDSPAHWPFPNTRAFRPTPADIPHIDGRAGLFPCKCVRAMHLITPR